MVSGDQQLPSVEQVRNALEDVEDGHIPVSLRRMGMLDDIRVNKDGVVDVDLRVPCPGCPALVMMEEQVEERLMQIPGVAGVRVDAGLHLEWTPDNIEPDVRDLMRRNGIQN